MLKFLQEEGILGQEPAVCEEVPDPFCEVFDPCTGGVYLRGFGWTRGAMLRLEVLVGLQQRIAWVSSVMPSIEG
jgi:hypothetical protein